MVIEYLTCDSWYLRYGSTVYSSQWVDRCSIWGVFGLVYSLKFKMTRNPKHGVKFTLDWSLYFSLQGLPKCHYNTINWLCPLNSIHQTYIFMIFALLTEERFAWYLFDFSLYDIVFCTTRTPSETEAGSFDHWCFPCTCCLTGLNCYNVTSGSAICNNVTSSSAVQVWKHGFTNLVSNIMIKWYF